MHELHHRPGDLHLQSSSSSSFNQRGFLLPTALLEPPDEGCTWGCQGVAFLHSAETKVIYRDECQGVAFPHIQSCSSKISELLLPLETLETPQKPSAFVLKSTVITDNLYDLGILLLILETSCHLSSRC